MKTELINEVEKIRRVFEEHHPFLNDIHFNYFPNGSCGHASRFLAKWLESKGVENIRCMGGMQENGRTHTWLEIGDDIVDITSDQFSRGYGAVYIDSNRQFHDQFINQKEEDLTIAPDMQEVFKRFWHLAKQA